MVALCLWLVNVFVNWQIKTIEKENYSNTATGTGQSQALKIAYLHVNSF